MGVWGFLTFTRAFDIPMTPTIEHLFIYPIKSMGGVSVAQARVTDRGLEHDRRWMLVDENGRFITQREEPRLCFFSIKAHADGMLIRAGGPLQMYGELTLPWKISSGRAVSVSVWSDQCAAIEASAEVNHFFSQALQRDCRLVYMPDSSERPVDLTYSKTPAITAFGDGYPVLLIGTASLSDLNSRMIAVGEGAVSWDRFRPNVVVRTEVPFDEDYWSSFEMGSIIAQGVKLCSRCVFTTIDQQTGIASKEPLRTLASYRKMGSKVMFGQHVIMKAPEGELRVGDEVRITMRQLPPNAVS